MFPHNTNVIDLFSAISLNKNLSRTIYQNFISSLWTFPSLNDRQELK